MSDFRVRDLTWRGRASYAAHAFKAMAKQHHKWMIPVLSRFLEPEAVVFDVGGHAGQYAKLFAGIARRGRVFCFEPSPYARSILGLGLRANRLANVTVIAEGLSDVAGTLVLTTPLKPAGTFRYGLAHMGNDGGGNSDAGPVHVHQAEVTTIDDFVGEQGLERLDFIKMDVEGWEARILAGGAGAIRRLRPVLLVELDDQHLARAGDDLATTWDMLLSWGYRAATCHQGSELTPLDGPSEGDVFWIPGEAP